MEIKPGKPINIDDLPHRAASDYKRIYANNATMAMNFFDAGLTFGEIVFDRVGEPPYIEDRVTVGMAWEHLRALHQAIGKMLDAYETTQSTKIREAAKGFAPVGKASR
jgi:hypothetical protein